MVGILVLGGIQMIMLGMIGEYLWRNLDETRKRPLYFIERKSQG
jgi:dolichol-phosphate mannosyltransferase